jgi:predicted flap endonuclease-1-like 5' DNA nuclease
VAKEGNVVHYVVKFADRATGIHCSTTEAMMARGLGTAACTLALLLAQSASASTYPLDNVLPKEAAATLAKAEISDTDALLTKGATPAARTKLAKATGLDAKQLLAWVRMCDVVRVKGVGPTMAKLLEAAGVKSVAQLRNQKAKPLSARLEKVNEKAKITQKLPSEQHLEDWISQAKKLKIVVK